MTVLSAESAILRRINSLLVAAGIYLVVFFCPTRLNIADDPSRDVPLRAAVVGAGFEHMDFATLNAVATHPRFRRWASNWTRLVFLLLGASVFQLKDRSSFRTHRCNPVLSFDFSSLTFDRTLGYPGGGPPLFCTFLGVFVCLLSFSFLDLFCCRWGAAGCCCAFPLRMPCRYFLRVLVTFIELKSGLVWETCPKVVQYWLALAHLGQDISRVF